MRAYERWITAGIFAVVLALALAVPLRAAATLSGSDCPGAGCVTVGVERYGAVGIQITGSFSGTISFTQSIDCATFVALTVKPNGSGSGVTSTTSAGLWTGTIAGAKCVRVSAGMGTTGSLVVSFAFAGSSI